MTETTLAHMLMLQSYVENWVYSALSALHAFTKDEEHPLEQAFYRHLTRCSTGRFYVQIWLHAYGKMLISLYHWK